MKLFILTIVTTLSLSAFAQVTCTNVALKDNVEACYPTTRTVQGKYTSSSVTNYVLEYSCDLVVKYTTSPRDAVQGYSSSTQESRPKRINHKRSYRTLSYCKKVADHLEEHDSYPGLFDQAEYFLSK